MHGTTSTTSTARTTLTSPRTARALATTAGAGLLAALVACAGAAPAQARHDTPRRGDSPPRSHTTSSASPSTSTTVISTGRWIVRARAGLSAAALTALRGRVARTIATSGAAGGVQRLASTGGTFAARLSSAQADAVRRDPRVAEVVPDGTTHLAATSGTAALEPATTDQADAPWGLDRTDQADLPLDGRYRYAAGGTGTGVTVYVVDSGARTTHAELAGRLAPGRNVVPATYTRDGEVVTDQNAGDVTDVEDCEGHGTHVAGLVAGSSYGAAKGATVVPVRAVGCDGAGAVSWLVAALTWVSEQQARDGAGPALVSISLTTPTSAVVDAAVEHLITQGVPVVAAAGNDAEDACTVSPASAERALSVGAMMTGDVPVGFSNYGACVDLYAPGSAIVSAGITSDTATATLSGTSMAAPLVAGVLADLWQLHPGDTATQLTARLLRDAARDRLSHIFTDTGDPNVLLQGPDLQAPAAPTVTVSTSCRRATVHLAATDAESGLAGYAVRWTRTTADSAPTAAVTAKGSGALAVTRSAASGTWYAHVRAVDHDANASSAVTSARVRLVDCPKVTKVTTAKLSGRRLRATVTATDPGGSITSYRYVVNHSKTSTKGTVHTTTSRRPALKAGKGRWYVHVRARSDEGRWSAWKVSAARTLA